MPYDTSFDLGEITAEELRANDELRRRANARKLGSGVDILAAAESVTVPGPVAKGTKITPDELAQAMGAKILGPTKNR